MMDNKGEDGIPHRANTIINDMTTALYGFQAIAPALYAKRDDGRGRFIDISLMRGAANLSAIRLMSASQGPLDRMPRTAPSGIFRTGEGWLQLVILQDKDFLKLCDLLNLDDLGRDESLLGNENRLAQVEMLLDRVETVLLTKPAAYWRDLFTEAGLQNEMLQDFQEFLNHPQVAETELFSWLSVDGLDSPWPIPNPPGIQKIEAGTPTGSSPVTGQHTDEVLAELGYDTGAIASLHERDVITTWTAAA
jgi:crotonobetainyl-CoA:carnitine CoA-transferase CaiB-like acyl-CoA transferase